MFTKAVIDKMMEVLSEILSKKYNCKITIKAIPKDSERGREILREREEKAAILNGTKITTDRL